MVVMPEYLMTSSKQNPSKPRIISEVKKNCLSKLKLSFTTSLQDFGKPKYSGQLLWNTINSNWLLTTAEVRQGSLILINKETSSVILRQPLRELNLRACSAPRTFCLGEAAGVRLIKFQAQTEEEYEKWVRILAAELIRQTPFQNVRFLDILSIIRNKEPDKSNLRKGKSEECVAKDASNLQTRRHLSHHTLRRSTPVNEENKRLNFVETESGHETNEKIKVRYQKSVPVTYKRHKIWMRTQSMNNLANVVERSPTKLVSDESGMSSGDENHKDSSIRPEDDFSFLSVKERKKFFESLNTEFVKDTPLLLRSNSISNFKQTNNFNRESNKLSKRKRTKSLHDLHKTPVKEICQLFESQKKQVEQTSSTGEPYPDKITQRRLQRRERKLEKLTNQIAEVEETLKTVTEDIKSIGSDSLTRKEGLEVFTGLQKRLDEENSKLARLKDEMNRVIKGSQRTISKMEKYNEKRNLCSP